MTMALWLIALIFCLIMFEFASMQFVQLVKVLIFRKFIVVKIFFLPAFPSCRQLT